MHQCLKCGRTVQTVTEIEEGCPCGSKVFVFTRHPSAGSALPLHSGAAKPAPAKSKIALMPFSSKSASPAPACSGGHPPDASACACPAPAPAASPAPKANEAGPKPASPAPPPSSEATAAPAPRAEPVHSIVASAPICDEEESEVMDEPYSEVWLSKGGRVKALGPSEPGGVENVRQLSRGVYELELRSLSDGPMVVRDADGVYYVRLPFAPLPGPDGENASK
ncbi:MAG: hypothetical protein KGH63_02220 [Candidatus Micrarchaeota archaeon]|nr:hypothetical protein [Candidatus Micrarchaeota archaeon]